MSSETFRVLGKLRMLRGVEEDLRAGGCEKIGDYRWWQARRYEKACITKPPKSINVHKVIQVGNTENSHDRFISLRGFVNL